MSGMPGLLIAYYGDDFTGSTDAMEALTLGGVPTVLFFDPPAPADLNAFPTARAVGVAGVARSKPPEWMDENLPEIFSALHRLGAPLLQYKVCSTFDSSPRTGSIGHALAIGRRVLRSTMFSPIVVGAPALKRYVVFGNLFAGVGPDTYRLDRHPTMSRHPVTPMNESDLVRHLGTMTNLRIAKFDMLALADADPPARLGTLLESTPDAVLFDTLDAASLERVGALVWSRAEPGMFAIASSGLNYALAAHWRATGFANPATLQAPAPVDRIAIVSGSCSPTTAAQIAYAEQRGFAALRVDPCAIAGEQSVGAEIDRIRESALQALKSGRSVVAYTASGPDDPAVPRFEEFRKRSNLPGDALNERIGRTLGTLLKDLLLATGVRRAMICGGDTSGPASRALGLHALTMRAPLAPGSPLCAAHARDARLDGLEIALKGGQVGGADYFAAALGRA